MREMVGGCCVCSDDRGWSENPLVYCDGQSCTVAVHQACYGIVSVPTGPWYCCKCESQERSTKVKCELCPSKYGALKRTDNQGWAHVVCALYIPEVRFGNVSTMEPIQLHLIPTERFNKVCYICEEKGKPASATVGACMQCNKLGCKQQFHVTCAQSLGLLCEEAGNYLDNVKYCGYCQHHYSKLKKGGNVKTIPPYKPVADNPNSDSNSEKESESGSPAKTSPSQAAGKRRSGAGAKNNAVKVSNSGKSSGSQQKSVHSNNKGSSDKRSANSKTAKGEELPPSASPSSLEKSEKKSEGVKSEPVSDASSDNKDTKPAKKRRGSSRTPTPVQGEVSVVVSASQESVDSSVDKKHSLSGSDSNVDKLKKAKVEETTQSILSNQPVVALTSIATPKSTSPPTTASTSETSVPTSSIIQTAQAQIHAQQQQQQHHHHHHPSLVVSVPLLNASLSPNHPLVASQGNPLTVMPFAIAPVEKTAGTASGSGSERATPVTPTSTDIIMPSSNSNQGLLSSEMSGGGLKITYEKQTDSIHTEVDMEIEMDTPNSTATIQEIPAKRNSRSQSNEKTDTRLTRGKKRNGATPMQTSQSLPATLPKRSSRSQQPPSPPPVINNNPMHSQPGAFAAISQNKIKDSPPSSPGSESQSTHSLSQSSHNRGRTKSRKSAPAAVNVIQGYSKDDKKDNKIFTNGMAAPHMLGNQLNPNSTMHAKMTDHLSNELEAHSIYNNSSDNSPTLVGPQLHHKVVQSARASSTGSSTASGGSASGLSSMLGGSSCGGSIPQTLDQLLERQWEQGSQFLMEQAQHFDIASLLSCLHQLRAENLRLEEHVNNLVQRRDHLLAVNARLAIPLTGQPPSIGSQSQHPNNIHPNMSVPHADIPRPTRHSTGSYDRYPQGHISVPMENGLPPDPYPSGGTHRDSVGSEQPSPTVRHSPAAIYSNNGLLRQCADTGGRAAPPRAQPYSMGYDRAGSSSHPSGSQQMVIRRDRDPDVFGPGSQPS